MYGKHLMIAIETSKSRARRFQEIAHRNYKKRAPDSGNGGKTPSDIQQ